jgi:AcrR family transcriptional regulator
MTVFEICEAAGVSRKTFYKYYPDAFSLLLAMQDDLFVGFEAALEEVEPNIFDIMPVLITFIDRHRVLMRASFANRGEGNFIDHVISYLYEVYQNDWEQANPAMSTLEVRFLFQYVVSGILGVLRFWLLEFPDMGQDEILSRIDYLMRLSTPPPVPPVPTD